MKNILAIALMATLLSTSCFAAGRVRRKKTGTTAAPTISSLSVTSGSPAGGTNLTITGTGFLTAPLVEFGGAFATNVVFNSSTSISCTTPAGIGTVSVIVTNTDGRFATATNAYNYLSVSGIAPALGPTTGGTAVVISGAGFSGSTVTIGGTPATGVTVVNSTQITATTPAGSAGAANVVVTNTGGFSSTLTNGYLYTNTTGTTLFSDGFESGVFVPPYDFVSSTDVTINTNPTFVHSGTKSAQFHYQICGDSTNPACGADHQDRNRFVTIGFADPGQSHFFVRGYVYLKAPESGASANIQRKLLYIKAKSGPGGVPNYLWGMVLTTDTDKYGMRLQIIAESGVLPSPSYYGLDNELGNNSLVTNGIFEFQTGQWYALEMEVKAKSALGATDSAVRVWVNGVLTFQHTVFTNGTVGTCPGRTYACPAFPGDGVFGNYIRRIEVGDQADRVYYRVVDEYRYWDDLKVSDSYIGP